MEQSTNFRKCIQCGHAASVARESHGLCPECNKKTPWCMVPDCGNKAQQGSSSCDAHRKLEFMKAGIASIMTISERIPGAVHQQLKNMTHVIETGELPEDIAGMEIGTLKGFPEAEDSDQALEGSGR